MRLFIKVKIFKLYSNLYLKFIIYFIFILISSHVYGFTSVKNNLAKFTFRNPNKNIVIDLYSQNKSNLKSTELVKLIESNFVNWTKDLNFSLSINELNQSLNQSNVIIGNKVSFNSNTGYFSSGVLAVTVLNINELNGEILNSQIILNDNVQFSLDKNDTKNYLITNKVYLNDILNHEFGHFFGLSHSQVNKSTMFYKAFPGQYSLHDDDKMGIENTVLNSLGITNGLNIKGKVVGSKNATAVFGANVLLYSQNLGKVIGGVISDESGNFRMNSVNIDTDDNLFFFIKPIISGTNLPSYLYSVQKNFCGNFDFKGSFYSSCEAKERGYPRGLSTKKVDLVTNRVFDLKNLGVNCDLSLPSDYLDKKFNPTNNINNRFILNLISENNSIGNSFVGFFTNQEINSEILDHIHLDFSFLNDDNLKNEYLDLKISTLDFYSPLRIRTFIYKNNNLVATYPDSTDKLDAASGELDEDLNPNGTVVARIKLSENNWENIFDVYVMPLSLTKDQQYSLDDYIFDFNKFSDSTKFYFFNVGISQLVSENKYKLTKYRNYQTEESLEQKNCSDAFSTYSPLGNDSDLSVSKDADELNSEKITSGRNSDHKSSSPFSCLSLDNLENYSQTQHENSKFIIEREMPLKWFIKFLMGLILGILGFLLMTQSNLIISIIVIWIKRK
jgi:hypothetical protein